MSPDVVSNWIAAGAILLSVISLVITLWTSHRQHYEETRIEAIAREAAIRTSVLSALQGEKESVAFTALHFSKAGLPADPEYREQVILALIQAAIFTSSDGARAIVLGVLADGLKEHKEEISLAVELLQERFKLLKSKVPKLDLERRQARLEMIKQALT